MNISSSTIRPDSARTAPKSEEGVTEGALFTVARLCGVELTAHPRVGIRLNAVAALGCALAEGAAAHGAVAFGWDDPKFWPVHADPSIRSQLLTLGNTINFRFWRLSPAGVVEPLGGRLRGEFFAGSMYMWRKIRLAVDAEVPLSDAEFLATMNVATFDDLFRDDDGINPLSEGIDERVANLRDLGKQLRTTWEGTFANVLRAARDSLPEFMQLSRTFRAFDDPLGKLSLVNALMHQGSGLVSFQEPLLPAIDYQLTKQLLRQGVLLPDQLLSAKLREGQYLEESEALQLRSAAFKALLMAGSTTGLPGDLIDNQLWRNRTTCTDTAPRCESCSFNTFCAQDVDLQRPLQLTRHY